MTRSSSRASSRKRARRAASTTRTSSPSTTSWRRPSGPASSPNGSRAFDAPSQHAIEERILHAAPHALPVGVPVELERIARRCLEKEPARRFQSASELHEQLSAFQSGLPAPASVLDERLPARRGRHAARYAAIGLLAAPTG